MDKISGNEGKGETTKNSDNSMDYMPPKILRSQGNRGILNKPSNEFLLSCF
jgi:hypothetical protein